VKDSLSQKYRNIRRKSEEPGKDDKKKKIITTSFAAVTHNNELTPEDNQKAYVDNIKSLTEEAMRKPIKTDYVMQLMKITHKLQRIEINKSDKTTKELKKKHPYFKKEPCVSHP